MGGMEPPLILIVEDEKDIARFIELELQAEGYRTEVAHDGITGLSKFREVSPNLVILDLMLPVMDGIEVAKRIRKTSNVPILILTAKDRVEDKVAGLDAGADDYLVKPFAVEELLARLEALLRRAGKRKVLRRGPLLLDLERMEARLEGNPLPLTRREFALLAYLAERPGRVCTREELLEAVWGPDYLGTPRTVDQHVLQLREKLGEDPKAPRFLETVRGVGYRFREEA